MTGRTYRVTVSTGGWRTVPWPFGLLDVADTGLRIHSWHWSLWVADKSLSRESIETVELSRSLGARILTIRDISGCVVKVQPSPSFDRLLDDLRKHCYF
jgi:hypothetical protein